MQRNGSWDWREACAPMFTVVLFTVSPDVETTSMIIDNELVKKMRYIQAIEYKSAVMK